MKHEFTPQILAILENHFPGQSEYLLESNPLLGYLNIKTKSATQGSKSRGSFANVYAIFVLVEDYESQGFSKDNSYSKYGGARFSDLFARQRELPFGSKLQNHGLNSRLNEEFKKYFPSFDGPVIIRDPDSQKYWINESLLIASLPGGKCNLSAAILEIILAYVDAKQNSFKLFIAQCEELASLAEGKKEKSIFDFVEELLQPNVDARLFEIVSYAILKATYEKEFVWFGFDEEHVEKRALNLYKTGRTNANDGGIDFVMRPLGRFFQVTESLDLHKYFLDIDKVQRFPITFVVKSELAKDALLKFIETGARDYFPVDAIVARYMESIEELINLPILRDYLKKIIENKSTYELITEISLQSRLEFNALESNDPSEEGEG
jgi:hypothetical protein